MMLTNTNEVIKVSLEKLWRLVSERLIVREISIFLSFEKEGNKMCDDKISITEVLYFLHFTTILSSSYTNFALSYSYFHGSKLEIEQNSFPSISSILVCTRVFISFYDWIENYNRDTASIWKQTKSISDDQKQMDYPKVNMIQITLK